MQEKAGAHAGLFVWAISFIVHLENKNRGTLTR
jgi:hypothetical protein